MGYVLRVRLASFFAGAAVSSLAGIYFLHQDYKTAHDSLTQQVHSLYESLDGRITALEKFPMEKLPDVEVSKPIDADL